MYLSELYYNFVGKVNSEQTRENIEVPVSPRLAKSHIPLPLPSISTPDSIDWKEPSAQQITARVVGGTKSGSILLFHNDLENTTEALPELLKQLKEKGFEFVSVSELIYHDNYSIDATGKQIPDQKTALDINITPENIDAVIARYSAEIAAAGFTEEQAALAAQAVKNGAEIPQEVLAVISQAGIEIPVSSAVVNTSGSASAENNNVKGGATK